jgi:CheY-like chemotaxis protein
VAEDDEQMRDLLLRVLGDEGYEVTAAGRRRGWRDRGGGFDLLTDVRCPASTGWSSAARHGRQLRQPSSS